MPTSLQPRGAYQAPLSMGFPSQEYWSELPLPPPRDLPDPGIQPMSPVASALQEDSLSLSYQGSPNESIRVGGDYYNTHREDSKSLPAVQETWV